MARSARVADRRRAPGRLFRAVVLARRAKSAPELRRGLDEVIAIAERRVEGRGSAALDEDLARALDALRRRPGDPC